MGTRIAVGRAFTLHDSDRGPVSLEFSLAPIFPSRPGDLRGGSFASKAGVTDSSYKAAEGANTAKAMLNNPPSPPFD